MRSLCSGLLGIVVLGAFVFQLPAVQTAQAQEHTVYSFCSQTGCVDGAIPVAGLIDVNGLLYGTTFSGAGTGCYGQGCGTVFSLDPGTGTETVLHTFSNNGTDGALPIGALIDVTGTLYGTTSAGGSTAGCYTGYGCGAVFSLDPGTGAETVLYSFCSQAHCTDGESPEANLIEVNGILYGTTAIGGDTGCYGGYGCGTVFSLDPGTGQEKVVYTFCSHANCADGANPYAGLIDVHGQLYGTTYDGGVAGCIGDFGCGTAFSLDPGTGREKVVYAFCSQAQCTDGDQPYGGLLDVKGALYGTTSRDGASCTGGLNCGTVFSLDPKTGTETVLHTFCSFANCSDGSTPEAGVIEVRGTLYGTTQFGGGNNDAYGGTVFSLDPGTGTLAVLHAFCGQIHCQDGEGPEAGLLNVKNRLYGVTSNGGTGHRHRYGTVFWVKRP
jgi:uncharacterized repeat protein (TIGR03803 family)